MKRRRSMRIGPSHPTADAVGSKARRRREEFDHTPTQCPFGFSDHRPHELRSWQRPVARDRLDQSSIEHTVSRKPVGRTAGRFGIVCIVVEDKPHRNIALAGPYASTFALSSMRREEMDTSTEVYPAPYLYAGGRHPWCRWRGRLAGPRWRSAHSGAAPRARGAPVLRHQRRGLRRRPPSRRPAPSAGSPACRSAPPCGARVRPPTAPGGDVPRGRSGPAGPSGGGAAMPGVRRKRSVGQLGR